MTYNNTFHPCPMCRSGLADDPQAPVRHWDGKEWRVFQCSKNCTSEVWVRPFKGIKENQSNGSFWWPFGKR